jgi:hypothetical protein
VIKATRNLHLQTIKTPYNSDGLINCFCQPGLLLNRPPRSMREEFNLSIKFRATRTAPSTGTKSMAAGRSTCVMVFAIPP